MAESSSLSSSIIMQRNNNTNGVSYYPYEEFVDERTKDWLLVSSPWYVGILLATYLLMVHCAPKLMARQKKPFQLRGPLLCYNVAMAMLNAYICIEIWTVMLALKYNVLCQPYRISYDPYELRMAAAAWWFYISKVLEFADTLFFILRKKWSQLSFLHVYHHSTMFIFCWILVKWMPTGSTFIMTLINSFIHIIMYSYYALSSLGPWIQRYLWWKRYLTALQLLQFSVGVIWGCQALLKDCEFQVWLNYTGIMYMMTFIVLFGRFYVKKYTKKNKEK